METSHSGPNVKRLIMVPALIALAITIFRLVGELAGGSSTLFNRAAGGGGALIGIVWLVPIFGVYFAVKLVGQGFGPASAGKVIGLAVGGLVIGMVLLALVFSLTGDPNVSVSFGGAIGQQLGAAIAALVVVPFMLVSIYVVTRIASPASMTSLIESPASRVNRVVGAPVARSMVWRMPAPLSARMRLFTAHTP